MGPLCSSNQIHVSSTHRGLSSKLTDEFISTLACPWGSKVALKWDSNCQVETAHRYGWCASSKTIHLADNGTGSHSEDASQRQKPGVANCVGTNEERSLKENIIARWILLVMESFKASHSDKRSWESICDLCCHSWEECYKVRHALQTLPMLAVFLSSPLMRKLCSSSYSP